LFRAFIGCFYGLVTFCWYWTLYSS